MTFPYGKSHIAVTVEVILQKLPPLPLHSPNETHVCLWGEDATFTQSDTTP